MRALMIMLTALVLSATAQLSHATKAINGMGTEFAVYDATGVDFTPGQGSTWYVPPQRFRTPIGLYQLNPTQVSQQLTAMRASGQTDISLMIWSKDFNGSDPDGLVDWVYGENIDFSLGQLRPQQRTNLTSLLQAIRDNGFKRVIVRIGCWWPTLATSWNETEYQKIWNFVSDVRQTVEQQLQGSTVTSLYDLGPEGGGLNVNQMHNFFVRMWKDYCAQWGNQKTVGFSFAWVPGRFNLAKQWYTEANGIFPSIYAFDIYPDSTVAGQDMRSLLAAISAEMGSQNGQPIIIAETWQNDSVTASGISNALNGTGVIPNLNLDGLFQWSLLKSRALQGLDQHFSQQAIANQSSTTQISSYRPMLAVRRTDISNSSSTVYTLTDQTCGTTTSATCTVKETWSAPPAGKTAVMTVSTDSGGEVLHNCFDRASSVTDSWIAPGHTYKFRTRYQSSTPSTCTISNTTPDSISTVYVH